MDKNISFDNLLSFSDKEIAIFLNQKIDEEINKEGDDIDIDLITECSIFLRELQGKEDYSPDEEHLNEIWKNITEQYNKSVQKRTKKKQGNGNINNPTKDKNTKGSFRIKRIFLIAAILVILMSLMAVVAGANGEFDTGVLIFWGKKVYEYPFGEKITDGKIEIFNDDKARLYDNLKEFLEAENLKGIYFSKDFEFEYISVGVHAGEIDIDFVPKDRNVIWSIGINPMDIYGLQYDVPSYVKSTTENGIDAWSLDMEDGRYQLMFKIDEWYYCIVTTKEEKGFEIINNFTEVASWEE